jgi:non-heme chloroperoxidase
VAVGEGKVDAAALILIDAVARTERSGFEQIKAFMEQGSKGFASMDEDPISTYWTDETRPSNSSRLSKNVRMWPDGSYRWHWDPQFLATREKDLALRYARLSACARKLTVPTLLVRSGTSDLVSEDGVREFLSFCPHTEYVNAAGAGHVVTDDRNDVFTRGTLDFLGRHAPAHEKKPWQRIRT